MNDTLRSITTYKACVTIPLDGERTVSLKETSETKSALVSH